MKHDGCKAKHLKLSTILTGSLVGITLLSFISLAILKVSAADNAVDKVKITVPVACSLSSTGTNSHNAEINLGTYNSAIGETTISTFCNDNEGFAIYAVGFTDNDPGKNVLTSTTLGSSHDITTGTATSGSTSAWAMKLATISSPAPTYPVTIAGSNADTLKEQGDPDFTAFQAVPSRYTKVAYRLSGTDTGANAEGSTFTTTYQAYISPTQPAGTYNGKVKYTLVHPNVAPAPEPCPNNEPCTRIVSLPDKTTYQDGEAIDFTGIEIRKYDGDGIDLGPIPTSDLSFSSSVADIYLTDDSIFKLYTKPFCFGNSRDDYNNENVIQGQFVGNNSGGSGTFGWDLYALGFSSGNTAKITGSITKTGVYGQFSMHTSDVSECYHSGITFLNSNNSYTANYEFTVSNSTRYICLGGNDYNYTIDFSDITVEKIGVIHRQIITVSWYDQTTGETLSTSFTIVVER